jgi:hypothetical protein
MPTRTSNYPSLLDGLCLDSERRYWIERLEAQEDNCDTEADTGHMSTGVEIVLQMSHNMHVSV